MAGYLGIDIGGTKTLLATFDKHGEVIEEQKFPTPERYGDFLKTFQETAAQLKENDFIAAGAAVPGRINRSSGMVVALGNLPWKNEPIQANLEKILDCPVVIENDSKLAGLSEALLIKKDFKKVLYVTISTGISAGLIINGIIDPEFADSESGHMLLEHNGKLQTWESFASGKAIVAKYGKRAENITDLAAWKSIAHNIALGVIDLIAVVQPEIILFGGGVGAHYDKFKDNLHSELKSYEMPLVPIPPVQMAKRPEEAVIYGCYELAKATYGKTA
jgi:predicted NBD/HSP70 family sugar kinase